jgi:glycosyltransferase involved in cell wall biosynthesis
MRIAVIIPAHNEEQRIGSTVRAVRAIPNVGPVVVVDDGSDDATGTHAEKAGAEVVRLQNNVGKGAAVEAGSPRVSDADVVLLLDADLGESAGEAAALVAPVLCGDADMTIAGFPRAEVKAGFGLVKRLARWGIRHLGDRECPTQAPLSGQRALARACFSAVRPFSSGYGTEVITTVRALRSGFRIAEVQTAMTHAHTGRNVAGFLHRGRQFVHVALALLRLVAEPPPRRRTGDQR